MIANELEISAFQTSAVEASEMLKVMAHPDRLMVVYQLIQGELGVAVLQANSNLSQSALSQHLTVLRKHGIISARKSAQQVFYSLADERAATIVKALQTIFG